MRIILLIHRYLAVAVGLLMTLWCLSGFVMMYQSFPALSNDDRLAGLQTLDLSQCCDLADFAPHDETPVGNFRLEMLLGDPVLRLSGRDGISTVNLRNGESVSPLDEAAVLQVAREFAQGNDLEGTPEVAGIVDIDQWTMQSARRNAPAWHVTLGDRAATEIYINGSSGEVFQRTNRRERVLSWFGAIPHWLYPTVLRQNGPLWSQIVIWTSVLGTFLAATGLFVGLKRLRRDRLSNKLASPYVGWWYWHHISGLIFGVLVLTWVFSGLMTMNPWGALSGSGGVDYRAQITGTARWSELKQFLRAIDNGDHALEGGEVTQITPAVFNHELFLLAHTANNSSTRLNSGAQPAPLASTDIEERVTQLDSPALEAGLIHQEDNYYYGHKREVALPVYRVIMDDNEQTRLYINPDTGALRSLGSTGRWSRWIRTGLHDLDFPVLRLRPIWDIVVIVLLLGVTLVCATGTWMALRRIRRDYLMLRRWG
ncbi:MAG: PepSY domain-containing protein [Pseudohongiella sp.]|uniref:PepSY domain-containing protein n=1 Tax=Pseudohongiella sp. TaxID=1979412 RepID=UPI0034A085AB